MAVLVYFNIEVSQRSTYFLGKYYPREYLKVKIPHFNLFQGEYLFLEGGNYLLVNKYWGRKCFPVSNYWGVLFFGEYLLTVTPGLFCRCVCLIIEGMLNFCTNFIVSITVDIRVLWSSKTRRDTHKFTFFWEWTVFCKPAMDYV